MRRMGKDLFWRTLKIFKREMARRNFKMSDIAAGATKNSSSTIVNVEVFYLCQL